MTLKIDGISAEKTAIFCERIREIPKFIDVLHYRYYVWLNRLEQNARVINIRVFNNNLNLYFNACEELNLTILTLLEKEGIDTLHIEFRTYLKKQKQALEKMRSN